MMHMCIYLAMYVNGWMGSLGYWVGGWMVEWMDGWMDGWTDGRTDGRTDRGDILWIDGRVDGDGVFFILIFYSIQFNIVI